MHLSITRSVGQYSGQLKLPYSAACASSSLAARHARYLSEGFLRCLHAFKAAKKLNLPSGLLCVALGKHRRLKLCLKLTFTAFLSGTTVLIWPLHLRGPSAQPQPWFKQCLSQVKYRHHLTTLSPWSLQKYLPNPGVCRRDSSGRFPTYFVQVDMQKALSRKELAVLSLAPQSN